MARKTKPEEPPRGAPTVPPLKGIELLSRQVDAGRALASARPIKDDAYDKWVMITKTYVEKAFGENTAAVSDFADAGAVRSFPMNAGDGWWEAKRLEKLNDRLTCLTGLNELLQTEIELAGAEHTIQPKSQSSGHRIFLVHGHDEAALHEVARFLERLRQDVLVLREQPSEGRTIIEKFEEYADVGFAVVLLTPDDRGGTTTGDLRPRARQNVILELGYFLGRLGRRRVCALHRGGVEIPTDYSGVLYVPIDDGGGWRVLLARELRAAGFPVDMNDAL